MVRVQVPATTANLGPGFDCLGMALKFYNIIEMAQVSSGLSIEVHGEGVQDITRDESNIVYRAAMHLFKQVGFVPAGLRIRLLNNIPVARGLGSSASAIVGGLVAANVLSGNKLSPRELLTMASQLEGHPDNVAPALLGGVIISAIVEGEVRYVKIDPPPGLKVVVVIPDFQLSTRAAREVLPQHVSLGDAVFNLGRAALLVAALQQGRLDLLATAMEDRLHQPYRASLVPGMKKVLAAARLAGARGVCLSGAGPSIIALADSNMELIARVMKDTFRESGIPARALVLEPSSIGARALEIKSRLS
ncbi:MAG: homoserine kinase [Thermoanaerobacter sp.]|uniref:homoserine kinase n=1 Tax=Desulfofundulus thermocisternus TaxID=42471 RepID=UPI000488CD3D|nr:homoserine kinase [Desulfofundulus thermocisternus]MDK2888877.1 homoserine kinase [Thermoanaerobacter sp.]